MTGRFSVLAGIPMWVWRTVSIFVSVRRPSISLSRSALEPGFLSQKNTWCTNIGLSGFGAKLLMAPAVTNAADVPIKFLRVDFMDLGLNDLANIRVMYRRFSVQMRTLPNIRYCERKNFIRKEWL